MPNVMLSTEFIQTGLVVPEGKRSIEYCDLQVRGMYVAVLATSPGRGTYFSRWRNINNGNRTAHTKIGRTDEISLSDARKRALALKADIYRGKDPQGEMREKRRIPTFGDFFTEQYLPLVKAKNRSWENAESMFRLRIKDRFGSTRLDQITVQQLRQFHAELRASGLSGASCDHHIKLMRHVYSTAISFEVVEKNPAKNVPLFNADNRRYRTLSQEELARLLAVLNGKRRHCPVGQLIYFMLCCGCRVGAALAADWKQFDFENRVWRIPSESAKNKRHATIPINDAAFALLNSIPRRSGQEFVFRSRQTGGRLKHYAKTFARIAEEAQLKDITAHDIRRTFGSLAINQGVSLHAVSKLLTHSQSAITESRYAFLSTDSLQAASDAVSKVLINASDATPPDTDSAEVLPLKPQAA